MAGSWRHAVADNHQLLVPDDIVKLLENGGDWYEFAQEAYGMVWFLANQLTGNNREAALQWVFEAQDSYKRGLNLSPGVDGHIQPGYVEKPEGEDYSGQ